MVTFWCFKLLLQNEYWQPRFMMLTCSSELYNCWNAKLACPVVSQYLVVGHNPKVVATYSMSTGVCHLLTIREMTFLHAEQIFLTAKTHLLKITLESHAKFKLNHICSMYILPSCKDSNLMWPHRKYVVYVNFNRISYSLSNKIDKKIH